MLELFFGSVEMLNLKHERQEKVKLSFKILVLILLQAFTSTLSNEVSQLDN